MNSSKKNIYNLSDKNDPNLNYMGNTDSHNTNINIYSNTQQFIREICFGGDESFFLSHEKFGSQNKLLFHKKILESYNHENENNINSGSHVYDHSSTKERSDGDLGSAFLHGDIHIKSTCLEGFSTIFSN